MTRPLADLLDHILDDVRAGRATVEDSLAAHPEHASELAPLLRLAAHLGPAALPAPDAAARARMTARLYAGMAPAAPPAGRPWWRLPLPSTSHRLAAGAVAALALLAAAGAGGTAVASRNAAPGDRLYGVKQGLEQVEMAVRRDDALDRHTRLSGRRLAELQTLVRRDDRARIPEAGARFAREQTQLLGAAAVAPVDRADAAVRLTSRQLLTLAELRDQSPAGEQLATVLSNVSAEIAGLASAKSGPATGAAQEAFSATAVMTSALDTAALQARNATVMSALAELQQVIDRATDRGALSRATAQELRALVQSAANLGLGGDNAVVAASVSRLGNAIADCALRGCLDEPELATLHEGVVRGARLLDLPEPALPAVRVVPPERATVTPATAASAPTTAPVRQAAPAAATAPPSAPAAGGGESAPPVSTAPPTAAPAPAATAAGRATMAAPAPSGPVPAAAPARTVTRAPTAAATPERPPPAPTSAGVPATPTPAMGAPAFASTPPPSPSPTSTPTPTPTPTPTASPTPTPSPAPAASAAPAPSPLPAP